jgi:hypothetical protein
MRLGGQTLPACFSTDGVRFRQRDDVGPAVERFKQQLEKRLNKKRIAISWQPTPEGCNLLLQFVEVDRGRPGLGLFLSLFGGLILSALVPPARVRIQGTLVSALSESSASDFLHAARASAMTARAGLRVCADRTAKKTARTVWRWLNQQALQALRARPF